MFIFQYGEAHEMPPQRKVQISSELKQKCKQHFPSQILPNLFLS